MLAFVTTATTSNRLYKAHQTLQPNVMTLPRIIEAPQTD